MGGVPLFRRNVLVGSSVARVIHVVAVVAAGIGAHDLHLRFERYHLFVSFPYADAIAFAALVTAFAFFEMRIYRSWRTRRIVEASWAH